MICFHLLTFWSIFWELFGNKNGQKNGPNFFPKKHGGGTSKKQCLGRDTVECMLKTLVVLRNNSSKFQKGGQAWIQIFFQLLTHQKTGSLFCRKKFAEGEKPCGTACILLGYIQWSSYAHGNDTKSNMFHYCLWTDLFTFQFALFSEYLFFCKIIIIEKTMNWFLYHLMHINSWARMICVRRGAVMHMIPTYRFRPLCG